MTCAVLWHSWWDRRAIMPGFDPDFLSNLVALANFMRLSLLKASHAAVGECRIAGNPGSPTDHFR
jgi:hypothetical protein